MRGECSASARDSRQLFAGLIPYVASNLRFSTLNSLRVSSKKRRSDNPSPMGGGNVPNAHRSAQ